MTNLTALGAFLTKRKIKQKSIADKTGFSREKISNLYIEESAILYADEFFKIITVIALDLDSSCEEIFQQLQTAEPENKWKSKLGFFLLRYFKPQSFLQESTGIKGDRLNKILTDVNKRPYAEEIYLIAKVLSIKPSVLFEQLYADNVELDMDQKIKQKMVINTLNQQV